MQTTEETILQTARVHFVQKGFAAARMQEIADEAGINKALLHYYFRSKANLYDRVVDDVLDRFLPMVAKSLSGEGTFWERLERLVDTYITTLSEHPEIPFFIMAEISQKRESFIEKLRARSAHFGAMTGFMLVMSEEVRAGRIRAFPPNHLFLNIMGMLVIPFIARPIFQTVFDVPESDYSELIGERRDVIMRFLRSALEIPNTGHEKVKT